MKATRVVIERQGPPDVMRLGDFDLPPPGPGEARLCTRSFRKL